MPTKKTDCIAINEKTADKRLSASKVLDLKPGKYVFRVENKNVPYELGFWLRSKGYDWKHPLHKITKTRVSGGGLTEGTSRDYEVELKPGEYVYSCPLNTTPDYPLVVKWRFRASASGKGQCFRRPYSVCIVLADGRREISDHLFHVGRAVEPAGDSGVGRQQRLGIILQRLVRRRRFLVMDVERHAAQPVAL
ncbi:MAG: hypothetical protein VW547_05975 [Alphaproteobacteria bacterium]